MTAGRRALPWLLNGSKGDEQTQLLVLKCLHSGRQDCPVNSYRLSNSKVSCGLHHATGILLGVYLRLDRAGSDVGNRSLSLRRDFACLYPSENLCHRSPDFEVEDTLFPSY